MTRHLEGAELHWSRSEFADKSVLFHKLSRDGGKDNVSDHVDLSRFAQRRGIEVPAEMPRERVMTRADQAIAAKQDRTRSVWGNVEDAGREARTRDTRNAAERYRDRLIDAGQRGESDIDRRLREHQEARQRGPRMEM